MPWFGVSGLRDKPENVNLLHGHDVIILLNLWLYTQNLVQLSVLIRSFFFFFVLVCFFVVAVVNWLVLIFYVWEIVKFNAETLIQEKRIKITGVLTHKSDTEVIKSYKVLQNSAKYHIQYRFWKITNWRRQMVYGHNGELRVSASNHLFSSAILDCSLMTDRRVSQNQLLKLSLDLTKFQQL